MSKKPDCVLEKAEEKDKLAWRAEWAKAQEDLVAKLAAAEAQRDGANQKLARMEEQLSDVDRVLDAAKVSNTFDQCTLASAERVKMLEEQRTAAVYGRTRAQRDLEDTRKQLAQAQTVIARLGQPERLDTNICSLCQGHVGKHGSLVDVSGGCRVLCDRCVVDLSGLLPYLKSFIAAEK